MKTTIISCIALIMITMTAMSFTNKATKKSTLLIQPVENKISSADLSRSAGIITARLKDFSADTYEVKVLPGNHQIRVTGIKDTDLTAIEKLVTQQGSIRFYRVYTHAELSELLKGDNRLFQLFNNKEARSSDSKVGCLPVTEVGKVNELITSTGQNLPCRYMWSDDSDNTNTCLYALRLEQDKGALLTGNDLESVTFSQDKPSVYWHTDFSFKKAAISTWSEITKQNINKSIAIVIDNKVICAPVVRSVIESGKCSITGNFSENDVKLFTAFGRHGELPAIFKVSR